jgi:PAS domain S-box-containing protein
MLHEEEALRRVLEGGLSNDRQGFRALVQQLAGALSATAAWVTELLPGRRVRTLAFSLNGHFLDPFEYAVEGTPCETVISKRCLVHVAHGDGLGTPDHPEVRLLRAVSYLGMPLLDGSGSVLGHIAISNAGAMAPDAARLALFEAFAARATAELRHLQVEEQLRLRDDQLASLLESVLDAILILDAELNVVRSNPAAERLFRSARPALRDMPLRNLLQPGSASRLATLVRGLGSRPVGSRQLWMTQDLMARRADGSPFAAEAVLSRFDLRGQILYSLVLRNLDERAETQRQVQSLVRETEYLREAISNLSGVLDLLGKSSAIREIYSAIPTVGQSDSTVLILGETGTGKERLAEAIHRASPRAARPLVRLNCAAIPPALLEGELFGVEAGSFPGEGTGRREGRLALAEGGTLYLEEIGELSLDLQAKLLRLLQEGEYQPVGSSRILRAEVRVIAASRVDLRQLTASGKFRGDLYFCLHALPLEIPPLRDRGDDIELLAQAFAASLARRLGRRLEPIAPEEMRRLREYPWPGNIRELQNVIERAIILSPGPQLAFDRVLCSDSSEPASEAPLVDPKLARVMTARELEALERENLVRALEACGWRVAGENGAARLLGVSPSTVTSRMKALGVGRPR